MFFEELGLVIGATRAQGVRRYGADISPVYFPADVALRADVVMDRGLRLYEERCFHLKTSPSVSREQYGGQGVAKRPWLMYSAMGFTTSELYVNL